MDVCGSKGHSIAGLEYASQCFCGDSLPARAQPTPGMVGTCTMTCKGNSSEICGAGSRLSLYQKCTGTCQNAQFGLAAEGVNVPSVPAPAPNGPAPTAAPVASASSPASPPPVSAPASSSIAPNEAVGTGSDTPDAPHTSPSAPIATASSSTPGVISAVPSAAPSEAPSAPSTGNSSVTIPSGWKDAGCYTDPVTPRALQGITFAWWGQKVTSSGCVKYCSDQGFSYAGTENAGQCFCGNELVGGQAAPSSDCNMPCSGSGDETCGGAARLSLYKKSASTRRRRSAHLRRHGVRQVDATS